MNDYNTVIDSQQGRFIVNRNNLGVGRQLRETGSYDAHIVDFHIELLRALRQARQQEDLLVLDAGANIGVFSLRYAEALGLRCKVLAFEAQRVVYYMLCGNVALRSAENVHCFHQALGAGAGQLSIPAFDYDQPFSLGSVEFSGEQQEFIGQAPAAQAHEQVTMCSIDSLDLPALDFIKIDIEGMEEALLEGAQKTIERLKPVVFIEYFKSDIAALAQRLLDADYRIIWNSAFSCNWLCLPPGLEALRIADSYRLHSAREAIALCGAHRLEKSTH